MTFSIDMKVKGIKNPATLKVEIPNGVGSIPVGVNSPSIQMGGLCDRFVITSKAQGEEPD